MGLRRILADLKAVIVREGRKPVQREISEPSLPAQVERAKREWLEARQAFEEANEQTSIDLCIQQMAEAELKYRRLLQLAKNKCKVEQ